MMKLNTKIVAISESLDKEKGEVRSQLFRFDNFIAIAPKNPMLAFGRW